MRKYIYIFSLIVFSCSGGSDSDEVTNPTPTEVNVAPTIPSLVYPTNNLLCIDNVLEFKWNASTDENGDNISYTIEISKSNGFSSLEFTSSGSSLTKTFTLEKGIAYYWRVKAKDNKNASSTYSPVFSLYTEGIGVSNHLPFAPELISPSLGANEVPGSVSLSWSASDTDGDDLTFDVYFDTNNPPMVLVSENQVETTVDVTVSASIDYYWKIVVKDANYGQTIGQVWSFKTN
jgi:hypothetical protein